MCESGSEMRLSEPEKLVVQNWRRMVFSRGACPSAQDFGVEDDLPEALEQFLSAVGHGSRHRLTIGHPGCLRVTADEQQMLALIAACQSGNTALLHSHLAWLVRPCQRKNVTDAAEALADTLDIMGLFFPAHNVVQATEPSLTPVQSLPRASVH